MKVATVNPISFLSADDPPYLLMHGTVDNSVPFHQSELLYRALLARNLRASFVPILDNGHGGPGFGGITSGANVWTARRLGPGRRVVTVIVDSGLKYLQGDLFPRGAA